MKHFSRLIALSALLISTAIFIGCNDSNSSDTSMIVTNFDEGVTVWEGNVKFLIDENNEWYTEPEDSFISTSFQNVKEGDQILIIHTDNGQSSEEWRVFEFCGYEDWKEKFTLNGNPVNAKVGTWGEDNHSYLRPFTTNQTTAISLSASDADIINSTGGMIVYGNGFTVKKIVVVSDTVVTPSMVENLKINEEDIINLSAEDLKGKILYQLDGGPISDGISYTYFKFSDEVETSEPVDVLKGTLYHYDYDTEGKKKSENCDTQDFTYFVGYNFGTEDKGDYYSRLVKFKNEIYGGTVHLERSSGIGLDGSFHNYDVEGTLSLKSNGEITLESTFSEDGETETYTDTGTYTISDGLITAVLKEFGETYAFYYGDSIEMVSKLNSISELPPYEDLEL